MTAYTPPERSPGQEPPPNPGRSPKRRIKIKRCNTKPTAQRIANARGLAYNPKQHKPETGERLPNARRSEPTDLGSLMREVNMSDTKNATQTVKELQAALAAAKEQAKAEREAKRAEREAAKAAAVKSTNARNDLARRIVMAASTVIESATGEETFMAGMTKDEAAQCVAQWLHHLPTGKTEEGSRIWPGVLPKPDRADWR